MLCSQVPPILLDEFEAIELDQEAVVVVHELEVATESSADGLVPSVS